MVICDCLFPFFLTVNIEHGPQGNAHGSVENGVGDGAGVSKGAVARAAGDPDLGEPVHEGLAAVRVEHPHQDADESVVVGSAKCNLKI